VFAKIFGQIFDSSIAEDYNCRRMFMDLLVLSDPDGVVDMTHEAISRRTNVPIDQVTRYITQLLEPDPLSRSRAAEGARLVPVDTHRDWGWKIVNYHHYRKLRDDEIRRQYFRDKMRKYRALKKAVKYKVLTDVNKVKPPDTLLDTIKNASSSSSLQKKKIGSDVVRKSLGRCTEEEAIQYATAQGLPKEDGQWFFDHCEANGWTNNRQPIRDWKATMRSWSRTGYIFPSHKQQGQLRLKTQTTKYGLPLPKGCTIRNYDNAVLDSSGRVMDINQVRAAQ
jgi:hypothetical protein